MRGIDWRFVVARVRSLAVLLLIVFWLLDLALQIAMIRPSLMDDAESYATAGRHLLAGQTLYAPFQLAGAYGLGDAAWGRGFVYPPTAALLFAPLAPFGQMALGAVFMIALAALGWLAYRLARQASLGVGTSWLLAAVVTFSGPAINAASSGNVNLLIADALLASWLWPRSSGYLAVLGGLVKFFPAAGLLWTIRKGGSVAGPIVLGLGAVGLTTLVVGVGGWSDFLAAFAHGHSSSWYFIASPAQSLGPGLGTVVGYGLAGLALLGAWRLKNERVAFALLGWAMILPAPDWWSHYLVVPLAAMLPWAVRALASRPVGLLRSPLALGQHTRPLRPPL